MLQELSLYRQWLVGYEVGGVWLRIASLNEYMVVVWRSEIIMNPFILTCIVSSDWDRTVCSIPAQSGGNCVWKEYIWPAQRTL